ncbi:MmcQ/YjbR family DNA-binding protein [Glaesserella sp.]|uniref:MmcQ/YjbR family DNA-binding protein n=1 Tax=Glaesserella sp. TaxID=2094731 RepID=UPI00359FF0B7
MVKITYFAVFRHTGNQKWFGLVIDISGDKLGLADNRIIDVLNVKAPVEMVGQLRQIKGIFPAYHMNKEHWISVILDGGLDDKTILEILDDSYSLTAPRRPKSTA